jgi:hypothetical protein
MYSSAEPEGGEIDELVGLVQGHFIDWDLSNPKFIALFKKTHPHADEAYLKEMGGLKQVLLDELPTSNQTKELIHTLMQKTKESARKKRSILDAPMPHSHMGAGIDYFDLSVRAMRVLEDMGIDTVGKLIKVSKSDLLAHRYIGRITIKELTRKMSDFLKKYGNTRGVPWDPATADEYELIAAWIESEKDLLKPGRVHPKKPLKRPPGHGPGGWPSMGMNP